MQEWQAIVLNCPFDLRLIGRVYAMSQIWGLVGVRQGHCFACMLNTVAVHRGNRVINHDPE